MRGEPGTESGLPTDPPPKGRATRLRRALWGLIERHPVATVFVVALTVRVAVALAITVLAEGQLFRDDGTYPNLAAAVVEGETANWNDHTRNLYHGTAAFTYPLTALYWLLGTSSLVGQILVAVTGALAAALATWLVLQALRPGWAVVAGAVMACLPSMILWSSLNLKDAPVWAASLGIAVAVAFLGRSNEWRSMALWLGIGAVSLFLLGNLREHSTVVAAWAFLGAAWVVGSERRLARGAGALAVWLAIPWIVGLGPGGLGLVTDPGSLEQRRANNAANATTAFVAGPLVRDYTDTRSELEASYRELESLREQLASMERRAGDAEPSDGETTGREAVGSPSPEKSAGGSPPPDTEGAESGGREADDEGPTDQPNSRIESVREQIDEREQRISALKAEVRELKTEAGERATAAEDLDAWFETALDGSLHGGVEQTTLEHLPLGLSVMLLRPYPWAPSETSRVEMARWESFLWYPLLALAVLGLPALWRERRVLVFPLLFGGAITITYALTEGNFGTAFRHRGEIVWTVAIFAAFGLKHLVELIHDVRTSS